MLLEVREKLLYFVIPGILLLATPPDIPDWSILHSATLVAAIPGGNSKPFFMSLALFSNKVEGAVCKGRSFFHISPYPTEGQRNHSGLLQLTPDLLLVELMVDIGALQW